ncbi:MAG: Holliday junction branch migration protein RuvA, partial [Lachnospiraceae bacterium]|nr:Holliday junction branch migration protein RuvA [Lachnospiraceae bacterium]
AQGGGAASSVIDEELSEAVQALAALGYSNSEALRAVRKVKATEDMQTQDILKQALKYIGL